MCAPMKKKCYRRMCENIKEKYENTTELYNQHYQKMLNNVNYIESLTDDKFSSKENVTFLSHFKQCQRELEDIMCELELKLQEFDVPPIINSNVDTTTNSITSTITTQTDFENIQNEDTKKSPKSPEKCTTFCYQEYLANRTSDDELLAQKFCSLTRSNSSSSYENFIAENTLSRHSSTVNLNMSDTASKSIFETCSDESFSSTQETNETICNSPPPVIEIVEKDVTIEDKNAKKDTNVDRPDFGEEKKLDISLYLQNLDEKKKSEEAHCSKNNSNGYVNVKIVKKLKTIAKENGNRSNFTDSRTTLKNTNSQNDDYINYLKEVDQNIEYKLKNKRAPAIGEKCYICHIKSPSEFYIITFDSHFPYFKSVLQKISNVYHRSLHTTWFESKIRARKAIKNCCVAYVESHGEWCRAEVVDWCHNDTANVEIFLVDHGYSEKVHYNNLRQMLECFTEVPKYVQKCHLANIIPIDNEWSEEAAGILGFYSEKILLVNNITWENGSYAVELINTEDEADIALELIRAGAAKISDSKKMIDSFIVEQTKNVSGLTSDCDDCDDYENDRDLQQLIESRNVNEAIIGYDPKDCARYCSFVRPDGTCFKGKNCKLEHDPSAKEMLKYVTTLDRSAYRTLPDPFAVIDSVGAQVDLHVTYIVSVKKFYAQIQDASNVRQFFRNMNLSSVVSRYERIAPGDVLSIADIVCIKNEEAWYRAIIRSIDYCKEEYEVFLVDFGDACTCTKKDLHKLPDIFFNLPPQAIECNLINVKLKNDVDQTHAIKHFEDLAFGKNFHANVIYRSDYYLAVKLTNERGEDVGQKLVEAGYADVENKIITPSSILVD